MLLQASSARIVFSSLAAGGVRLRLQSAVSLLRSVSFLLRSVSSLLRSVPFLLRSDERGQAVFYTLVVLPIALSLTVLAVDVGSFIAARESAQQEADRVVLTALHSLPDTAAATRVITQFLAQRPTVRVAQSDQGQPLLSVEPDRISLVLEGEQVLTFGAFLPEPLRLRYYEDAQGSVVAADTVIVVADSASFRPAPGTVWGEADSWGDSKYFSFVTPIPSLELAASLDGDWWTQYRGWATNVCFNPAWSAVKRVAVQLADYSRAYRRDRIGVMFSPGENPALGFSVLRPLSFFSATDPEARWLGYFEPTTYISDEACVLFSDPVASGEERYRLADDRFSAGGCSERIAYSGWGKPYFPIGRLSDCLLQEQVPLRDAIYTHAARSTVFSVDARELVAALEQAYIQLLTHTEEAQRFATEVRGSLEAKRRIVLLTDTLPEPSSLESVLSNLAEQRVNLELLVFAHPFLSAAAQQTLATRVDQFESIPGIQIQVVHQPAELLSLAVERLLERTYVLRN